MADKAISKVVYGGETLIDLTIDDVTADKVASGIKFHGPDGVQKTGTCTYDADTSDATATAAEILATKTAYKNGSKVTGTMANNGAVSGTISTKDGEYTVPQGYHDGSGKVRIDATEKEKIKAENIRQGITILGVEGTMSGTEGENPQDNVDVTPSTAEQVIVPTGDYTCLTQVTVKAIPYVESENAAGGITVTIG